MIILASSPRRLSRLTLAVFLAAAMPVFGLAAKSYKAAIAARTFRLSPDQSVADGGAFEKYILVDDQGESWILKIRAHPDKAYLEEMAFKLARLMDLPSAPSAMVALPGGEGFGMLIKIVPCKGTLKGRPPEELSEAQTGDLMKLLVYNWLLASFDTHCRNFLVRPDDGLISIDHDWAFLEDDYSHYHLRGPEVFKDTSYYRPFFRAYRRHRTEVDLLSLFAFIDRVQAIPDPIYRKVLSPFAHYRYERKKVAMKTDVLETCHATPEGFLDAMCERKNELRNDLTAFFLPLLRERGDPPRIPPAAETAAPPTPVALALDDGKPIPLRVEGLPDPANFFRRLALKAKTMAKTLMKIPFTERVGHGVYYLKVFSRKGLHPLAKPFTPGLSEARIKSLDLCRLEVGNALLRRLNRTEPSRLRTLRRKATFALVLDDDAETSFKARRLVRIIDSILKDGSCWNPNPPER